MLHREHVQVIVNDLHCFAVLTVISFKLFLHKQQNYTHPYVRATKYHFLISIHNVPPSSILALYVFHQFGFLTCNQPFKNQGHGTWNNKIGTSLPIIISSEVSLHHHC